MSSSPHESNRDEKIAAQGQDTCPRCSRNMSWRGQALIAAWLLADVIGMVVMAALHIRGWVFPVAAFAPLVAPIFLISASGYGGE